MFIKLHSDGEELVVNTKKVAVVQKIIVDDELKTQIIFSDDFVVVDESVDEVFELLTNQIFMNF